MPKEFDDLIKKVKVSLRKAHPNWSEDRLNNAAYGTATNIWKKKYGKAPSRENLTVEFYAPILISEGVKVDSDFEIEGTAITETITRNGIKYTAEELESAAPSLKGKPILKDHRNEVDAIVGKVMDSSFGANAVRFRGKIMDEKVKQMVRDGRINNVSIGARVRELKDEESNGEKFVIAKGIEFLELSLTPIPGDPSAGITLMQAIAEKYDLDEYEEDDDMEEKKEIEEAHLKKQEVLKMEEEKKLQVAEERIKQLEAERKSKIVDSVIEVNPSLKREELEKKSESELELMREYEKKMKAKMEEKTESKGEVGEVREKHPTGYITETTDFGKNSFWKMPNRKGEIEL